MAELKTALEGTDIEAIKAKSEALETAIYPITEAMYRKASEAYQAQAGADAGAAPEYEAPQQDHAANDNDAVDAEFEEK